MTKQISAADAARLIPDNAMVAVNSSSGLCCPDAVLAAIGARFDDTGAPRNLTTIHPIAAGDFFGTKGIDHIAKPGCLSRIIGGSYPSGPTNAEPPLIWQMITANQVEANNVPSGIVFDMLREGAGHRPGVLTQVGMDTFVDPEQDGCAMNDAARAKPIVRHETFDGQDWLYFQALNPQVAIIRASTADQRGNLSFESEGAYLGLWKWHWPRIIQAVSSLRRYAASPPMARSGRMMCACPAFWWTTSSRRPTCFRPRQPPMTPQSRES